MTDKNEEIRVWCQRIAGIAVDALMDKGLVAKPNFDEASAIVEEEIFIRLIIDDYPPPCVPKQLG